MLEGVLAASDFGEHLVVRQALREAKRETHSFDADKGVGALFEAHGGRHGGEVLGATLFNVLDALKELVVFSFNGGGEFGVGFSIFMGAEELGLIGQVHQTLQRAMKLFIGALDDSTTAEREDGVTNKAGPRDARVVGDMALGDAADIQNVDLERADEHAVGAFDGYINTAANEVHFPSWAHHDSARILGLEFLVAAGVIGVVMSIKNMGQSPIVFV